MTKELTTQDTGTLATVGEAANQAAAAVAFADYQSRKAYHTLRRQKADLALFTEFLATVGHQPPGDLYNDPAAWQGITWGLVDGFVKWQLTAGYAVGSVNIRLSTVKTYAALATKAEAIDAQALAMIKEVKGYSRGEGQKVNEKREAADIPTRMSREGVAIKKAAPVSISPDQAAALKAQPDTPQGRRDRLLMCLLLDHGLRAGELARLTIGNFDLKAGEFIFSRPKVDKVQTHELTKDTQAAAVAWFEQDAPGIGPLLRGSRKGGYLTDAGMSVQNITARVRTLGERIGIEGLSAHDCRHYWATQAARSGTTLDRLKEAGGWSNYGTPLGYIEAARIANAEVYLE